MIFTHKTFLSWLLYITVIAFSALGLTALGLPQLTLAHDHAHLSLVLILMYVLAEVLGATQAIQISREHRRISDLAAWLKGRTLRGAAYQDGAVRLVDDARDTFDIPPSPFADHIGSLMDRARAGKGSLNHSTFVNVLADRLYHKASIVEFVASRIVWVGILATIVGVIWAFWPFMQAGLNIETMKGNLAGFFSGIAVAFIPTAVSFVFKIALDINARILTSGVGEIIDTATVIGEAQLVPFIRGDADAERTKVVEAAERASRRRLFDGFALTPKE